MELTDVDYKAMSDALLAEVDKVPDRPDLQASLIQTSGLYAIAAAIRQLADVLDKPNA